MDTFYYLFYIVRTKKETISKIHCVYNSLSLSLSLCIYTYIYIYRCTYVYVQSLYPFYLSRITILVSLPITAVQLSLSPVQPARYDSIMMLRRIAVLVLVERKIKHPCDRLLPLLSSGTRA